MSKSFDDRFAEVAEHARQAALLQTIADTLEWDEQTGMPAQACEYRAEQVSLLRGMCHAQLTDERFGNTLSGLSEEIAGLDRGSDVATTVRELHRSWLRNRKLPVALVKRLAETRVRAQHAWDQARKQDDFSAFAPLLTQMVQLKREEGQLLAEGGDAYQALIDEYEPGANVNELAELFAALRPPLVELVANLANAPHRPDVSILQRHHQLEGQRNLSRFVAEAIGFDFSRGRLDETAHPFCTNLGPDDCRILSRYDEHWLPAGLYGTLHEAGHGLYEQGLRKEWYGLPPGSYASLGIHESQSRLWENQVGRSRAFWEWLLPMAKQCLGWSLANCEVDEVHAAVNFVQPSLIRVEADEATYNLHIIIRFELEKALLSGDLAVADLPGAWNQAYRTYLGIESPTAADGVLQDVHWSAGLFGYFPTYTIGSLAAAQIYAAAEKEFPELPSQLAKGEFLTLRNWLGTHIHQAGRCYQGAELIERVTGSPLSIEPLLTSLRDRYDAIYWS